MHPVRAFRLRLLSSAEADRLALLDHFNALLLKINPLVRDAGGFVDKYLSGGLMVLFPDRGERALRCAVAMARIFDRVPGESAMPFIRSLSFHAGLHRGELMLGTIGERERMEGTVVSDAVNIASRLSEWAVERMPPSPCPPRCTPKPEFRFRLYSAAPYNCAGALGRFTCMRRARYEYGEKTGGRGLPYRIRRPSFGAGGPFAGQSPLRRRSRERNARIGRDRRYFRKSGRHSSAARRVPFSWHEFHSSVADFPEASFAPFPGSWKGLADATPYGWASWGATITGLESGRIYALAVGQVLSACEVYINGKRALSIGRPGVSEELETPFWDSRLVRFTAAGAGGQPGMTGQAEIVIRVSNWNDRMGGTNAGLAVGDAELLRRSLDRLKLTDGLVFGVLGVMGLFFAALFIFRPTDRSFLWFALLCGTVGFRALCYDSFTLLDLVPGLPWTMLFRLGYLTFPFAMISFSGFLRSAYPELVTKRLFFSFSAPFAAYIAVIILFGTNGFHSLDRGPGVLLVSRFWAWA